MPRFSSDVHRISSAAPHKLRFAPYKLTLSVSGVPPIKLRLIIFRRLHFFMNCVCFFAIKHFGSSTVGWDCVCVVSWEWDESCHGASGRGLANLHPGQLTLGLGPGPKAHTRRGPGGMNFSHLCSIFLELMQMHISISLHRSMVVGR